MYYADYFINGGLKSTEDGRLQDNGASFEWQCCTGTFPQDVAEYANLLYYHSEEGLFVSQYLPSDVTFSIGDKQVRLENTSFYPKEKSFDLLFTQRHRLQQHFIFVCRHGQLEAILSA